jgi:hypothetical protein
VGAFHCRENAFGIFVSAQCEILDVDKTLSTVDLLCDTLKISKVVGKEFDGIPIEGRETT